jgi:hypothetical protein
MADNGIIAVNLAAALIQANGLQSSDRHKQMTAEVAVGIYLMNFGSAGRTDKVC